MFFKSISVSVIIVFLIVIYAPVGVSREPVLLSPETSLSSKKGIKKEVAQVPLKQEELLSAKNEYKSYIITGMSEKSLSQNIYVGDKKEIEVGSFLQNKANTEGLPSLQSSLNTLSYNALIPTRDIMDTTRQKAVPQERSGSVLISPFAKEAL